MESLADAGYVVDVVGDQQWLPNSIIALASSSPLFPGIQGRVGEKHKAGLVISVALWSLRERRAVEFSSWVHTRWWWPFDPVTELMLTLISGDMSGPEIQPHVPWRDPQFSLEQELFIKAQMTAALSIADSTTLFDLPMDRVLNNKELARITRRVMDAWINGQARAHGAHQGEELRVRVRDVVSDWLGEEFANPHREVIDRVTEHARVAGCMETAVIPRGNPVAEFLFGPRVVNRPSPARAAEMEIAAQRLAREWQRFLQDERAVAIWLIDTVMDAIRDRTLPREFD